MSNQAWVTLATNDSYSLGALVLAHSLRRVGSTYPAVILITPSVTEPMRERLRAVFTEVILVNVLDSQDAAHLALLQRPELGITFTKIHCWNLTQYEKCVFLDADILVLQNCDELFGREELSAAPDVGWPDCFNSGVFVFRPSKETFDAIIKFAQERGSFDGGDQGLLNSYFSDWALADSSKRLPFLYNVTSAAFYSYLPALKHYGQDIKIIHFIGAAKPWLQNYNWDLNTVDAPGHLQDTLKQWWNIFVSQVHPQLDVAMVDHLREKQDPSTGNQTREYFNIQEEIDSSGFYMMDINPDSEFSWHRPNNKKDDKDKCKSNNDFPNVFDPWDRYGGNIPPGEDVWEYKEKVQSIGTHMHSENVCYIPTESTVSQTHVSQQHHHQQIHHNYHYDYHHEKPTQVYHNQEPHHHIEPTRHNWDDKHDQNVHIWSQHNEHSQFFEHHSNQTHHEEWPHNKQNEHLHLQHIHNQDHAHIHHHQDHSHMTEPHPHTKKEQNQVNIENHNQNSHLHNQTGATNKVKPQSPEVEKKRPRNRVRRRRLLRIDVCSDAPINGRLTESDSEEEIPRHPYDGFYLRHIMTVDSRGRKVCSHQLIRTPPPSPTPSPTEVIQPLFDDSQSGVAGSLAKVVPGPNGCQHEAIDEVSRRQGWESGNIDYMGVDSFDNIWAKISQTLSQAPKRTSPSKELAPEKQPSPPKESVQPKQPSPPKEVVPAETKVKSEIVAIPTSVEQVPVSVSEPETKLETTESTPVQPKGQSEPKSEQKTSLLAAKQSIPEPSSVHPVEAKDVKNPVQKPPVKVSQTETESAEATLAPIQTIEELKSIPENLNPDVNPKAVESSKPVSKAVEKPKTESVASTVQVIEESKPATEDPKPEADLKPATEEPKPEAESKPTKQADGAAKSELVIPPTPPVTPKSTPESSTPVSETAPVIETTPITPVKLEETKSDDASPTNWSGVKAQVESSLETSDSSFKSVSTSDSSVETSIADRSPPLVNTPSKETPTTPSAASKTKKPAGKLQLSPPQAIDPLPTPDSELEDAATLAQGIIARELAIATPTVTAATPPILSSHTPQSPKSSKTLKKGLSVESPVLPTPPAGPVSLEQIGVKPTKQTIAAQIETSVAATTQPETIDAPKKTVKKTVKKENTTGAPVPPPRKKEKKPK